MENVLAFLRELNLNNDRDWFQANKDWYLETREQFEQVVTEVIKGISTFDNDIQFLNPKDCMFRIYRDVRFSKNKDPYKTNMGAAFSKGGKKSSFASYYLHIEPGNCFLGGGKWRPSSEVLKSIRYEIYQYPEEFINIIEKNESRKYFDGLMGEKLIRPPKDFPPDFEHIDLLKYKSFTIERSIPDEVTATKQFLPEAIKTYRAAYPFISFLNRAAENV